MLHIYRSSRLEHLAERLSARLYRSRPANALAPQTVVVGHPGMRRWLLAWLANHPLPGLPAIAANIDVLLPGEWVERVARSRQIAGGGPGYRRAALRWRIDAVLQREPPAALAAFLAGGDARKRFALADRLAALYTQYLIYRGDVIERWQRGQDGDLLSWQGALWRELRMGLGDGHRLDQTHALLRALDSGPTEAVEFFGLSHLPPDVLAIVSAYARNADVAIYFCDPCRELWPLLPTGRAPLASELDGVDYWQTGHPLLSAWGRLGQHFALALNEMGAIDDARDARELDASSTLLARVQNSVRTLTPLAGSCDIGDASLRVHVCATRLRELEALRDALLDALARDPTLNPADIVVMAPSMHEYAPLLRALLGPSGLAALPYHIADAPPAEQPYLTAFAALLDWPLRRFARSEVLDFLRLPPCARRFSLRDTAALEHWIDRAGVHFALDATMRDELGAGTETQNTWAFGIERMFAGWALGDVDALIEGVRPAAPIEGPGASELGALTELLKLLADWRAYAKHARPLREWARALEAICESVLAIDSFDTDEQSAQAVVARCIADLEREARDAAHTGPVAFAAVRSALQSALDEHASDPPWFNGGVRFCGLVPQRSVPYRVVAILGLNDGEFPRVRSAALDLIEARPRIGDRLPTLDDKYLMLEALMSARQMLHLSYLGIDAGSGSMRNPAQPLQALLDFLPTSGEWRVEHASAVDGRYGSDPRYPTFAALDASAARRRFSIGTVPTMTETSGDFDLAALREFYRRPARHYLQTELRIDLRALDSDEEGDDDPLDTLPQAERFAAGEWIGMALASGGDVSVVPPQWRDGHLPPGPAGERLLAKRRERVDQDLRQLRTEPLLRGRVARIPLDIDLGLRGARVRGRMRYLHENQGREFFLAFATRAAHFGHWLPLLIEWKLHAELRGKAAPVLFYERPQNDLVSHPQLELLPRTRPARERRLWWLLAHAGTPDALAAHFLPKTSYAFATKGWRGAQSTFESELKFDPYAARLISPELLAPGTPAAERFERFALRALAVIEGKGP